MVSEGSHSTLGTESNPATDHAARILDRRSFAKLAAGAVSAAGLLALGGCATAGKGSAQSEERAEETSVTSGEEVTLPAPEVDPDSEFGIDKNVNMETIDRYVDLESIARRDLRMVADPARYEEIGGNSELSILIENFRVAPYPYIGTVASLPVPGAYDGPRLYDITWGEGFEVIEATPCYEQSLQVVEELFPRDVPLLLMCGGAGYAAMMKALLIYLGWDEDKVYNVGGAWDYSGHRGVQLISYHNPDAPEYYLWRADIATIDFDYLR